MPSARPGDRATAQRLISWKARSAALGQCQLASLLALALPVVGALVVLALLLLPVGIGFWLLPPAARALRALSDRSRRRVGRWTDVRISPPEPLASSGDVLGTPARTRAVLADAGFWRDVAWAWLEPLTGGLLVAAPLALVEYGVFGALVQPFIWQLIDDGNWYAFIPVISTTTMLAAATLGLGFVAAGTLLAPEVLRLHARWSRRLLSAPRSTELARRVNRLTATRADALDAQASELRRIERDLHDGAQASLVSLGLSLDSATRLLDTDPQAARARLLEVRETSARALQELRDLVHGVLPPVLADRGLGDAVRSLALDSFLDVHVDIRLPGPGHCLPSPVESAAYFAVSELLANATKHAGASEIHIVVEHTEHAEHTHRTEHAEQAEQVEQAGRRGTLRITVTDNGTGGADASQGTGLRGVRRRLDTFDGILVLQSPQGGPTTVTMEIPCALSSPKTSSC
ncbi:sensor histidine kinase [Streptomyces sp. WZ.A104]|uniref:sensor histidine kinase n=1 Tax=Streptomyces sp. WZ.A104 TaxID=2023771 RepID=UPI000BBB9656|nr:sensor domain-containing protein [Streptomyces sp. WZ.A104]PCG81904.1 sensor histidine kinase [Streptomyces sp. WZ.A104]